MPILGQHKKKYVFIAHGIQGPAEMLPIVLQIIKACGMTPARDCRIDTYPYDGKGGLGYTLYQPLCESYCIADVYYDLFETEILISTCKPGRMDTESVLRIMKEEIGPATLTP